MIGETREVAAMATSLNKLLKIHKTSNKTR